MLVYVPAMTVESTQIVSDGKVVTLHYQLRLDTEEVIVDTEADEEPMDYLHGSSNIISGLETALAGKRAGDVVTAVIAPDDGYGPHDPDALDEVPRDAFPDDLELEVGLQLSAEDEDGDIIPCVVKELHKEHIVVDMNHPLAGQTLHYVVKVLSVRDAAPDEIEHGHPHGDDDHDHE